MHIVHALFTPGLGGLEEAYVHTTRALVSQGYQVSILCHPDSPHRLTLERMGCAVYTSAPRGFYDLIRAWKIRKLLLTLKPDVIIAHNARAITLLTLAARGMNIPVCGVSHSYKTARTMRADHLVVVTEHMRNHFIQAGFPANRLTVIPNFIDLPERYVPKPRKRPVVIGVMGRFTPEKGMLEFLKSLQGLQQLKVPFHAVIAGDGEQAQMLYNFASANGLTPHITWMGWVTVKALFYESVDIVCIPSLEESFGLVVLEALAHGIPVVATDTFGPASIISHGLNGLIVGRGDARAMAVAVQQLVDHPEKAKHLVEAGWIRVQDFGFKKVAGRWDTALKSIVSGSA